MNYLAVPSTGIDRPARFAPASVLLYTSRFAHFWPGSMVSCLRRCFGSAWLWLILLPTSLVSVVSRCFVPFGAPGVGPQKFPYRDKLSKKKSWGPKAQNHDQPKNTRNHRASTKTSTAPQAKPPPKLDQPWAAQARLAYSTFWVGSALYRPVYSCLYPPGNERIPAGTHT